MADAAGPLSRIEVAAALDRHAAYASEAAAAGAVPDATPAPDIVCDWCRRWGGIAFDLPPHLESCPEYLAWVIHPDEAVHRDYWVVVGDFHKLHLTRVLGVLRRGAMVDRWRNTSPDDGRSPQPLTVAVAKRGRDGGVAYENMGQLNRPDGYIFNTLEGARSRALRIVAHYEATAAQARKNVEGPPTVRKYAKALTAKRLAPPREEA
jgi:hypothetical protein